jgi:hypothetical protein
VYGRLAGDPPKENQLNRNNLLKENLIYSSNTGLWAELMLFDISVSRLNNKHNGGRYENQTG